MKLLHGVTTAMVTPFDEKGNVQLDKVEELTQFLIAKGVHCLYPLGTTGEMLRLSVSERKQVAETVVKKANRRVTVYIHAGAMNEQETIELAQHAYSIGADGIGVVTPVFFGANDKELEAYYGKIASSIPSDFPVYLYSIPQCATNDITPGLAHRLAERFGNIVGIKYSFPDFLRVNDYLTIRNGHFSVVPGTDRLFLPALAMGCDGIVSGVSSVYPEPFVAVYNAFRENDIPKARKLQRIATKYCEALKNGGNMAYFKEALKMRGIDAGSMKSPQLNLTEDEAEQLRIVLKMLDQDAKNEVGRRD